MGAACGTLQDLIQSVTMIAEVPRDVALEESVQRRFHSRRAAFKDVDKLFANTDGFRGEIFETLVEADAVDNAVVLDEADLVFGVVELLVEGEQVVDVHDDEVDYRDRGHDLDEVEMLVELLFGEERRRDTLT